MSSTPVAIQNYVSRPTITTPILTLNYLVDNFYLPNSDKVTTNKTNLKSRFIVFKIQIYAKDNNIIVLKDGITKI